MNVQDPSKEERILTAQIDQSPVGAETAPPESTWVETSAESSSHVH